MLTCIKCAVPLVLEGPAGVGKTKLVEVAYRLLAPPEEAADADADAGGESPGRGRGSLGGSAAAAAGTRRRPEKVPTVQFSKSTTLQDVVGQWRPSGDACVWVDGPLYLAMRGGYPLLCDEMNLAPSDVISFLVPLLDSPRAFA